MDELLVVLREIRDEMRHLNTQIESMNANIESMSVSIDEMNETLADTSDEVNQLYSSVEGMKGYGLNATLTDISRLLEDIKGNGTYDSIADLNEQLGRLTRYVSNIEIHVTT